MNNRALITHLNLLKYVSIFFQLQKNMTVMKVVREGSMGSSTGSTPYCPPQSTDCPPQSPYRPPQRTIWGLTPYIFKILTPIGLPEAYGVMSMGFYNGRGVYGTREAFFLPPLLFFAPCGSVFAPHLDLYRVDLDFFVDFRHLDL